MVTFLQEISEGKAVYLAFTRAKDADVIMRNVRQRMMENLQESLQEAFPDAVPDVPIEVLTNYLVSAQMSLIDWWITNRTRYDADQNAAMLHPLQLAAVRDAFGLDADSQSS